MNNRLRILDTDILSNWQRGSQPIDYYIQSIPNNLLATTIITVEEQFGGRLKRIKECGSSGLSVETHLKDEIASSLRSSQ